MRYTVSDGIDRNAGREGQESRTAKKAHPTMQMGGKLATGCELNVRGKVGGVVGCSGKPQKCV